MPSDPARPPPSTPPVYESVRRGPMFEGESSSRPAPRSTAKRFATRSFYWTMPIAIAGVAVLAIWISPELTEPPPHMLAPPPTAIAPPAPTTIDPVLASAYGEGALRQAERETRRIGIVGAKAVACALKSGSWLNELRAAASADIMERYPTFDNDQKNRALLGQFALEQFDSGQREGEQDLAVREQQEVCSELPALPDYRAADRLARDVAARRLWPAPE
jgi:hypothetical protein